MANNKYEAKTIQTLSYFEHIRQYPGVYIGSKDIHGLHHCAKEIISNSIDEYLNGSGDEIIIKVQKDGGIFIKDNGRGIPHGTHESGCSTLQACYGIANTGGKFNNATGETGYNTSGGEHGIGGKAVNALSTKMVVTTARDGIKEIVEFSKGNFISYDKIVSNENGVSVLFYPDKDVFETVDFDIAQLRQMLQEFSFLCTGLTFKFIDEKSDEEFTYYSDKGLYDYINYLNGKKEFLIEPWYFSLQDGNFQLEAVIGYNSTYTNTYKLYTNNIPQEKGTHLTGFRTAFTQSLNAFARDNKLLKEKEENLSGSDLQEGQVFIINFKMIDPVFKGQNKEELSSSEGRTYVQKLTTDGLKEIFQTHKSDVKEIINKALAARRAREAAKKARDAARNIAPKEKGLKAKMAISDKFIDCSSKNPKEKNLLIVEGLSAAGSVVESRNVKTDSIYMLRGKIISPLKQSIEKILANQEMSDIIKIIGAGFGNDQFNLDKMAFDKIVIASDQDSDGAAIELLLVTFFYTYMRPLVETGKLYRAVTPLYIVTTKKNKYYCYSEAELSEWKSKHNESYELVHCKG